MPTILIGTSIFLTSCGGGESSTTPQASTPTPVAATKEIINGITVPLAPDATANVATPKGVDSNNNGIRDDIDRYIAQNFGNKGQIAMEQANKQASTLQAAIIEKSSEKAKAHDQTLACSTYSQLLEADKLTRATLNTPERARAYADAFRGVQMDGCSK